MWWVTSQKNGASALGLKASWVWEVVPPGRCCTSCGARWCGPAENGSAVAWGRRDLCGGRRRGTARTETQKKALVAIAAEEDGAGIGRTEAHSERPSNSCTASPRGCHPHRRLGRVRRPGGAWLSTRDFLAGSSQSASELLPHVHRVAALLKRWLIGTHQGAVSREHLDYYLDELRFDSIRRSRHRGKLFYRLVQQAATVGPTTYSEMVRLRGRRTGQPQDVG